MDDQERDDQFNEDREEKLFNRREAERLLPQLESLVTTVVQKKKVADGIDQEFAQVQNRILLYGGVVPPYGYLAEKKLERDATVTAVRQAVEQIEQTGCVVKDLDLGLVDFRSVVNNEPVYLCWKLGESSIQFYHRVDEGFAGRKPLGPPDASAPQGPKPN